MQEGGGKSGRRPRIFCIAGKFRSPAIRLLSAIARGDLCAPRKQGVRFSHGVAMSPQKIGGGIHDKAKVDRPSVTGPLMNERQRKYFREKLVAWKEENLKEARDTLAHLQ